MELLSVNDLAFSYSGSDKCVLDNITFSIEKGSFNLLIGKSGSGKSTILKLIKPDMAPAGSRYGKIVYAGKEVSNISKTEAIRIGLVGQDPDNQIVTDKVWHELSFGLENMGLDNARIRSRVAEMAEYFGINEWYERDTATLSGGQKQAINLASVMVMQPDILLLDEPTAQLDPITTRKFFTTLLEINRDLGVTVLCAEHNIEEIFSECDKCIALRPDGMGIEALGGPKEVAKRLIVEKSELVQGLPVASRIYGLIEKVSRDEIPLSVQEGRKWINSIYTDRDGVNKEIGMAELNKSDICISINNVTFAYKKKEKDILRNLDFSVKKGIITTILGGNGAGKSTLLKLIAKIEKPQSGSIRTEGQIIMLPQNPLSLFTEISVEEELGEVLLDGDLKNQQSSLRDKQVLVDEMLERLGLTEVRKQHPYDLSGGQQQKLAIGKVMLLKPDVILMDEPTKGLDPFFKRDLGEWLVKLKGEGMTIVMVSHDVEFAAEYSDKCALLFDGEIASEGDYRTFFDKNMFYTTNVNRIMSEKFKNCVALRDVKKVVQCQVAAKDDNK